MAAAIRARPFGASPMSTIAATTAAQNAYAWNSPRRRGMTSPSEAGAFITASRVDAAPIVSLRDVTSGAVRTRKGRTHHRSGARDRRRGGDAGRARARGALMAHIDRRSFLQFGAGAALVWNIG